MRKALLLATVVVALFGQEAAASPISCVPYVRQVSAVDLRGDAWMWWQAAAGIYDRGSAPRDHAVLVFKRHGRMVKGHVAVVSKVVGPREVLVDHANWAPLRSRERGSVAKQVRVRDVSPRNDWSEVRVWHDDAQDFGTRTYPAYGFIYAPRGKAATMVAKADTVVRPEAKAAAVQPVAGQSRVTALLDGPEMCRPSSPEALQALLADLEAGRGNLISPTRVLWAEPTVIPTEMVSER